MNEQFERIYEASADMRARGMNPDNKLYDKARKISARLENFTTRVNGACQAAKQLNVSYLEEILRPYEINEIFALIEIIEKFGKQAERLKDKVIARLDKM